MVKVTSNGLPVEWFGLWVPLLIFALQSCANTPFGTELANSFDVPAQDPLPVEPRAKEPVAIEPVPMTSSSGQRALEDDAINSDVFKPQTSRPVGQKPKLPDKPVIPQPYRITIKLSGADPSAPAEAVTGALRMAGVNFEVETIERIKDQSSFIAPPSGMGANP